MRMVQPAVRIFTADQAAAAARALETPTEVAQFLALARESSAVRAFIQTPQWAAVHSRIMGDGKLPTGAARSLSDIARLFRWTSDGSLGPITTDPAAAYRHCAAEVEALDRRLRRAVPVSPAPTAVMRAPAAAVAGRVSFAEALTAVKAGAHITRESWPAESYVTAQAGYPQGIAINANTAQATWLSEGATAVFPPYLQRRMPNRPDAGAELRLMHWTPDQDDLFAEDWLIRLRG
jgi:hypothetical protein